MFQNFANYLLGSVLNQNQGATAEGVENSSSLRFRSEDREDDWVLVDRDSERHSDTCSVGSLEDEAACSRRPRILSRTSSTSSLPCASNMEESWFVTPPPCFTSAGPIHMETSPLENLLIEHPSMSVYHIHPSSRRHFAVTVPVRSASSTSVGTDGEESEVEDLEVVEQVDVVNRLPRLNRLQIMQQQERQLLKSKQAQKVQSQKACQKMKRGNLERNNKAREVNSRNRRQRRGERSQGATRSYANNNRKC
ncbi:hypothetical protein JTB14_022579 [Gonioctena quinquepunctata]|nr:hypothetical protein JTB14_022579 [Gonioctena quinquepunctata]